MRALALVVLSVIAWGCNCGGPPPPPKILDCEKIDCESCVVLQGHLGWNPERRAWCDLCQMAPAPTTGCENVPAQNGVHVIRGCNRDGECGKLTLFCGRYSSVHNICAVSDPI